MKNETPKFAIGQIHIEDGSTIQDNLAKAKKMVEEAKAQGSEGILFPEIGFETFFPKHPWNSEAFNSAEHIPGPISDYLCKVAKDNKMVICASFMEEGWTGEYYDSAIVIDSDGALLGTQRMVHTQEVGDFNEKFYYGNGNTDYPVFDTAVGKLGIAICYDAWFPEVCRSLAVKGADIILIPTAEKYANLPTDPDLPDGTIDAVVMTMFKAQALFNGCWVIMCNRVGSEEVEEYGEGRYEYFGKSSFINPFGQLVAQAGNKEEAVITQELNIDMCRKSRRIWPMLDDRRCETFGALTQWYGSTPYYDKERVNI